MKKYKVPNNVQEIIIEDNQPPKAIIRKLTKINKDWAVIKETQILKESND